MSKGARIELAEAKKIAEKVEALIKTHAPSLFVKTCGSILRGKETCGDVDLVVKESEFPEIQRIFEMFGEEYELVYTKGSKKNPPKLHHAFDKESGFKIEFYVARDNAVGAMTLFATGNGLYNIKQRQAANGKGFKLSQYGLFKGEELVAGETEEDIYVALGIKYLTPKEREF